MRCHNQRKRGSVSRATIILVYTFGESRKVVRDVIARKVSSSNKSAQQAMYRKVGLASQNTDVSRENFYARLVHWLHNERLTLPSSVKEDCKCTGSLDCADSRTSDVVGGACGRANGCNEASLTWTVLAQDQCTLVAARSVGGRSTQG